MKLMYMATSEYADWIACPAIDMPRSQERWQQSGVFANGGGWVRRSVAGHRVYDMSWNLMSADSIARVRAFFDGVYGDGPFYFIDPSAERTNVFPAAWASPRLALDGGPTLVYDQTPSREQFPGPNRTYPNIGARYVLDSQAIANVLRLPVPDGHTLHFRAGYQNPRSALVQTTRQALLAALANYTNADVEWAEDEPDDTDVIWLHPETGVAREGLPELEQWTNLSANPRGRDWSDDLTMRENLITNPRGRTTDGTVTVAENLVPNPSFETGVDHVLTGSFRFELSSVTTDAAVGNRSMRIYIGLSSTPSDTSSRVCQPVPVRDYEYLAFSGAIRQLSGADLAFTPIVLLRSNSLNMAHQELPYQWLSSDPLGAPEVAVFDLSANAPWILTDRVEGPLDPRDCDVYVGYQFSGDVGTWTTFPDRGMLTDAWIATEGATEAGALAAVEHYFDGDTWDGDPDLTPEWDGDPHESPSRLVGPAPVGWSAEGDGVVYYSQRFDMIACRLRDGGAGAAVTEDVPPEGTATAVVDMRGEPGWEVFTLGGWLPSTVQTMDSDRQTIRDTRESLEWLAGFGISDADPGTTIYGRVLAVEGAYDGPYFDGDTENRTEEHASWQYEWAGEPDESISVLTHATQVVADWSGGAIYYDEANDGVFIPADVEATVAAPVPSGDNTLLIYEVGGSTTTLNDVDVSSGAVTIPAEDYDRTIRVLVTEGEYDGDYADGSTAGWEWDGTPYMSTSQRPFHAAVWYDVTDTAVVSTGQAYGDAVALGGAELSYRSGNGDWEPIYDEQHSITGPDWAEFSVQGEGPLNVYWMQGVILPVREPTPEFRNFHPGQGNSGVDFEDFQEHTHSVGNDLYGASVRLREVVSWQ